MQAAMFVVVAHEFQPGTNDDISSMWVFPPGTDTSSFGQATPPPTTLVSTGADLPAGQIRSFRIVKLDAAGKRIEVELA